jgi:biopolymer transport protein ExbB
MKLQSRTRDVLVCRNRHDGPSGPSRNTTSLRQFITRAFDGLESPSYWIALLLVLAATTPALADEEATTAEGHGFFDIVFAGGWIGFLIMMALLALSLTAVYLIIEHIMTLRTKELLPEGLDEKVRGSLAAGRVADAEAACKQAPCSLSFVMLSGLSELEGGWPEVEKAVEEALTEQSARLFRKVEYLSVIGNIAPMVGLLGTVVGMIFAFQTVASTQAAGANELAEGIYQALVTTVAGLIVAIPSLGAFAVFRNRIDQLMAEVAYAAQHAFAPIKRRVKRKVSQQQPARRGDAPAPPPAPPVQGGG